MYNLNSFPHNLSYTLPEEMPEAESSNAAAIRSLTSRGELLRFDEEELPPHSEWQKYRHGKYYCNWKSSSNETCKSRGKAFSDRSSLKYVSYFLIITQLVFSHISSRSLQKTCSNPLPTGLMSRKTHPRVHYTNCRATRHDTSCAE